MLFTCTVCSEPCPSLLHFTQAIKARDTRHTVAKKWRERSACHVTASLACYRSVGLSFLDGPTATDFCTCRRVQTHVRDECVERMTATNSKRRKTFDRSQVCSRVEVSDGVLRCLLMSYCAGGEASMVATSNCILPVCRPAMRSRLAPPHSSLFVIVVVMVVIAGRALLTPPPLLHSTVSNHVARREIQCSLPRRRSFYL